MHLIVQDNAASAKRWMYFWAKHVRGFNVEQHCAKSLVGTYCLNVRKGMADGVHPIHGADPFDYFYLCGVSMRGYKQNLHIAVRPALGSIATVKMDRGGIISIVDAELLDISAVTNSTESRREFLTCRNWQFGYSAYINKIYAEVHSQNQHDGSSAAA